MHKEKQARIVTYHEENMLWERGVIGTHSPNSLLNAVFFFLLWPVLLFKRRIGTQRVEVHPVRV